MKTVSLALGQDIDALDYLIDKGDNNFRALYYPAGRKDILDQQVRAGKHTDYGSFTYLFQDDVGGLQVLNHKTQKFQHAPPIKDCCIVNCGDMMERITNNTFTSTMHQVVNPFKTVTGKDGHEYYPQRQSFAYFCNVNFDQKLPCLPNTYDAKNPKKFKPVKSFDYLMARLNATHI